MPGSSGWAAPFRTTDARGRPVASGDSYSLSPQQSHCSLRLLRSPPGAFYAQRVSGELMSFLTMELPLVVFQLSCTQCQDPARDDLRSAAAKTNKMCLTSNRSGVFSTPNSI